MNQFTTDEIVLMLFTIDSKIKDIDHLINDLKELESKDTEIIDSIKYWQREQNTLMRIQNKIKSL